MLLLYLEVKLQQASCGNAWEGYNTTKYIQMAFLTQTKQQTRYQGCSELGLFRHVFTSFVI